LCRESITSNGAAERKEANVAPRPRTGLGRSE
jgi:hypothetical protein